MATRSDLAPPWSERDRPVPRRVVQPLQAFLRTDAAGGVLLLVAALVALVWANSVAVESYTTLWETRLTLEVGPWSMSEDLRHWINDLLMALFFFFVGGMDIKRELVHGELRDPRAVLLPVVCAAGGMVAPALLYLAVNRGGAGVPGWGVPMATDIAFAVGVLLLAGRRVPAGSCALGVAWLQRLHVRALAPYFFLAAVLWFALFQSGVHATIARVALGLLTPAWPFHPPARVHHGWRGPDWGRWRRGSCLLLDAGAGGDGYHCDELHFPADRPGTGVRLRRPGAARPAARTALAQLRRLG